jgi:hypothetical protein
VADLEPDRQRSAAQRFFTGMLPWWAESMERESKEWIATCPNCGHERNYWEMGSIRWKAKSKGLRVGFHCPACGKRGLHKVERRPCGQATDADES